MTEPRRPPSDADPAVPSAPPRSPSQATAPSTPRPPIRSGRRQVLALVLGAAGTSLAFGWGLNKQARTESARRVPALTDAGTDPAGPGATESRASETAVLAGGCFWGVQAVYQHVRGVQNAVSGYAGGDKATADYATVSRGASAHAEAVSIRFDPAQIRYEEVLRIFFSVVHDPTQLDRQGPDIGPQYRSAIFPADARQAAIAERYIQQLGREKVFGEKIVTRIEPMRQFFPAEDYHQDYLVRHPNQPYIVANDLPKIEDLRRLFPERFRATPVLVADAGRA